MDILRFITAGNVDDGKSTLIGRLLYDTKSIKNDILASVLNRNDAKPNLAHITDGLRAERSQGITIDVAYKYFTTPKRKYIVTDAPGHLQYTKNLVTGASAVDTMIILIDALNGITEQTRRHSLVAAFLGIKQIAVAVNKMDLVGYNEAVFSAIRKQYFEIAQKLELNDITFIPISALNGDNVSFLSRNMNWYNGNTLEHYLENCEPTKLNDRHARFVVQYTTDNLLFGKLISGQINQGDTLVISPKNTYVQIEKILNGYNEVQTAHAGENLCLSVICNDEISRGDILCTSSAADIKSKFEITLFWLDENISLQVNKSYRLRIGTLEIICTVREVVYKIDVNSLEKINDMSPVMVNQFARVIVETIENIVCKSFKALPELGQGILIDLNTNSTSGAFVVE